MISSRSHDQVQELLAGAALEILEPAELDAVTRHVGECPDCAAMLETYRATAAELSARLPARERSPQHAAESRRRLLSRVRDARVVAAGHRRRAAALVRWSGWAVAAGLAGVLAIHHSIHRPVDYGWLAAGVLSVILLGLALYAWIQRSRLEALEAEMRGQNVEVPDAD